MGRLYDRRDWHDLTAAIRAEEPWCRMCRTLNLLTPADVVDHIIPLRLDPDLALEPSNLQPLCKAHHDSAKHWQEHRGYIPELDAHGYPVDPLHPANQPRRPTPRTAQPQVSQ